MKNLLFILFGGLFALNVNAQTPPVAVNDTFYCYFETALTVKSLNLYSNDSAGIGGTKIVDTVFYSGVNQIVQTYHTGAIAFLKLKEFVFTPQVGYFGLDSLSYVLTENGNTTFDTATIYIYVKRKGYENLNLNNISANINNMCLFQYNEGIPLQAGFNVPKSSTSSTIYGANLWVGGNDGNGSDYVYGPRHADWFFPPYSENYHGDAGPISNEYETYDYKWDRVWKVSKAEIDYHIAWYSGAIIDPGYTTPEAILNWPAHGDPSKGQALNLAPFYDEDGDGNYNALNGDYPIIKGQQAVYFIRNDQRVIYIYTGNYYPLKIELHGMAYAYDCPADSAINNTIFLNYKIYNRSAVTYTNAYAGMWTDFDIGYPGDDFVGCDVARGAFYGYNGDDDDAGLIGYGNHPPAQGVVFLKGPKKDNDGLDNPLTTNIATALTQNGIPYEGLGIGYGDGTVDNEYLGMEHFMFYYNDNDPVNGEPNTSLDFNNYLQGKWKSPVGSPQMSWGGDGTGLADGVAGAIPAKYMFPGASDPLLWGTYGVSATPIGWSEETEGNTPADRRGLGSTGPFTMQSGEMVELDLAFVFGRDYQNTGNTAAIVVMQERIDSIRSYYLDDFQSVCGGTLATGIATSKRQKENDLMVYPNPFNNQFMVNYPLENAAAQLKIFNMFGRLLSSQVITKQNTRIDLSNEASGIYFVQITDGGKRITKKMVKQ